MFLELHDIVHRLWRHHRFDDHHLFRVNHIHDHIWISLAESGDQGSESAVYDHFVDIMHHRFVFRVCMVWQTAKSGMWVSAVVVGIAGHFDGFLFMFENISHLADIQISDEKKGDQRLGTDRVLGDNDDPCIATSLSLDSNFHSNHEYEDI